MSRQSTHSVSILFKFILEKFICLKDERHKISSNNIYKFVKRKYLIFVLYNKKSKYETF